MNRNDPPRHPAEDTGVSTPDEVVGECEDCGESMLLTDAVTQEYAGFNGETVVLAFCRECASK